MTMTAPENSAHLPATTWPNVRRSHSKATIVRLAMTPSELERVYRFRYEVYFEEMHLPQYHANHKTRSIKDPLDRGAYNFVAFQDEEVVGVLRVNFSRSSTISYYEDFLNMHSVRPYHPCATSICTRLMVTPRLRGTSVAIRLCQESYYFALHRDIRYNFIDCNQQMTRFFERLGYTVQGRAEHPEYGMGDVMRLDLLDRAHLARVSSPFVAFLDRAIATGTSGALASA